jgi:hypothetical protein
MPLLKVGETAYLNTETITLVTDSPQFEQMTVHLTSGIQHIVSEPYRTVVLELIQAGLEATPTLRKA